MGRWVLFVFRRAFVHGCHRTWPDSSLPENFSGFALQDLLSDILALFLVYRFQCRRRFHTVDFAQLMHISLARACACDPQELCIFTNPVCGLVQATTFAYLSRPEAQRVLVTCILLLADQKDILLGRTEYQLGICLSSYSAATPPVQAFLIPVVPGQGGVWDLDTVSSSSNSSASQHAVEEEHIDAV